MEKKKYLSVEQASKLWNVPESDVLLLCNKNYIKGLKQRKTKTSEYDWRIPEETQITKEEIEEVRNKNKKEEILSVIFGFCAIILLLTLLVATISCAVNSDSNFISDGSGNYVSSGTRASGVQGILWLLYLAMPIILFVIKEIKSMSCTAKCALIIILTILTIAVIFPQLLEPGDSYSRGSFLGYDWDR